MTSSVPDHPLDRIWVEETFSSSARWPDNWRAHCDFLKTAIAAELGPALFRAARDGSLLVRIPAGEFVMGDGQEENCPRHRVWLDEYWISLYCVTNLQYGWFVQETGHRPPGHSDWTNPSLQDHPVVCVSWDDALAYAEWAGCMLPTEAQWEKAARGPKGTAYPWGNEWDASRCRHNGNRGTETTAPVHAYPGGVSGYGCWNMIGNVWEWCRDWYGENYYRSCPFRNPDGTEQGSLRAYRSGSWKGSSAPVFRAACRYGHDPLVQDPRLGFRLTSRQKDDGRRQKDQG